MSGYLHVWQKLCKLRQAQLPQVTVLWRGFEAVAARRALTLLHDATLLITCYVPVKLFSPPAPASSLGWPQEVASNASGIQFWGWGRFYFSLT